MLELTVRVVVSLAVVVGLLWFVARTSNKRFGGAARSMVRVLARQPLARSASLAVVEVGERVLVVGISENGVRLLTEMDPAELPEEALQGAEDTRGEEGVTGASGTDALAARGAAGQPVALPALGGSVLSAQTWRQAWAAATSRRSTGGD